jgi:hypothetical protein
VVKLPQIFHGELPLQGWDGLLQQLSGGSCKNNIIDIEQQVNGLGTSIKNEESSIELGFNKNQREQIAGKLVVPCPRSLLQTVQRLVEVADQVRLSRVEETSGLCAINHLSQHIVEECVLDVELVDLPIPWESKGQDGANRCGLHNRAESVIIIDAGAMCEPAKNPLGHVPLECPVSLELVLEYPLIGDNIGIVGAWNQFPSVVWYGGDVLFIVIHQWGSARAVWTDFRTREREREREREWWWCRAWVDGSRQPLRFASDVD